MLTAAHSGKRSTPSAHRLQLGLPGYLILFATLAFSFQRQYRASKPPSLMVFFRISTDFTHTSGIPLTSLVLNPTSIECSSLVELRDFTSDLVRRLHDLYTQ